MVACYPLDGTTFTRFTDNFDICTMANDMSGFSQKPELEPDDFYKTAEGYIVFTEKYLLKRGYCCRSGCRHCPYGFDPKTDRLK